MWGGGKRVNPEEESDTEPSTTTANNKKKKRNSKRKSAHLDVASSAGSSDDENYKTALELSLNTSVESEDEDMKRVLEMSKNDFVYIPDSDEEKQMKKAIALSLGETIVLSDDEFDRMCDEPNMSLKEKLSKSSLNSEGSTPGTCKTWSKMNEPDTSNLPVRPKPSQVPRMPRNQGHGASRYPEDSEDYEDYDEREEELSQSIGAILGMRNPSHGLPGHIAPHGQLLSSEEATRRMRGVFVNGLESKLNQEEMEPCKAIKTKLHSHQKSALAWMVKQENKENKGMMGGILGDEMGLGKTLTMISLIMTNYYDNRPLSKPNLGYTRPKIEMMRGGGGKGKKKRILKEPTQSNVGKKIEDKVKKRSAIGFFSNFKSSDEEEEEKGEKSKFSFGDQKEKKSKRGFINDVDSTDDEEEEDDPDLDEFDLIEKSSLSSRLKCKPEEKKIRDPRDEELDDMYSEWENMSQVEKDKKVRSLSLTSPNPGLNLDGAFDSSDDDIPICRKKTSNLVISSDDEAKAAEAKRSSKKLKITVDSDSDVNLSDIDLETAPIPRQIRPAPEPSSSQPGPSKFSSDDPFPSSSSFTTQPSSSICRPESTLKPSTMKRIVPLAEPAKRKGRAHPTLIICPTSLLSHWCQEIDSHILPSVELKVKVHHGSNKAKLGADLNTYDIVLSTYGTLANELNADTSPLLRAKWLRVILDEGHYIKNHRSKTAKAANQLRTVRRWVVTGTPIQNNLIELWSLVNWLQFDLYAGDLQGFKNQIERPCKDREESGFERLQVLMDAICLRRTKNDKRANGDPIVPLPTKTIIIRDVKFTEDEKLCYSILSKEATNIVERYHQRGTLLRNYAIIFALMMRMRQLCCHREMIKTIDWTHVLRDRTLLERELAMFMDKEENGGMAEGESEIDLRKRLAGQLRKMIQDGVTEDCSICLDDLKSPVITPCAHVYCKPCITRVLETVKPPICPLCRGSLSKNGLLEAGTDDDEQEERSDETLKALENIEVNVSSSKVNAAIKEMIRIREADPTDKIVVVSQFTTFLSIFQPILAEQGFTYVRLDGTMSHMERAEVVRLFQKKTANSPKVLLLSLKAGGVGLNLTSANHLLLLDPAWNPAAEWQCFDRIHRIGQEKPVTIYKFITKEDSIEEKMMEIQAKKEELISGAFHMPDEERRRQRINDIMNIFNIGPRPQPAQGLPGPPAVPAPPAPAPALAEA